MTKCLTNAISQQTQQTRNAEQLENLPTLLCSVTFQPKMALVMHLVYSERTLWHVLFIPQLHISNSRTKTEGLDFQYAIYSRILHILYLNSEEQPVHCVLQRRSIKRGKLAFRDSSSTRSASWAMNLTKDKLKGGQAYSSTIGSESEKGS